MADITWSDVIDFASELSASPIGQQATILARVNTELEAAFFGGDDAPKYKLARIYLAAHMASAPGFGGNVTAGPTIAESEGGVMRQYANSSGSTGPHGSTMYGQQFDELVATSPRRFGAFRGAR